MNSTKVMLLASFAESVTKFRGGLILDLLAAGADVSVCVPLGDDISELRGVMGRDGVDVHGVPLRRTGTSPLADLGLLLALFRVMRVVRPTTLLPYTAKPVIYGTIAGWLAGVPRRYALVTGLGYAFIGTRRGLVSWLVRRLYRFALRRTHKVFFQNPDDERLFRESGLLPEAIPSVVVNGSGVDVSVYAECPMSSGPPVFLMIGRLLGDKGVREYAQAARRVKALHPDVGFRLVGWIDSNPNAISQSELDAWLAEGVLEFLGKLDDVRPAIAAATVYVLPSYREGTPRTVLEAIAMGRPIITTDAPGCRETVVDGDNGFLVPVRSVDALVAAMLRFIEAPGLAARMGKRSRQVAEGKYDVHKVNAVMLREMGIAPAASEGANDAA